MTTSFDSEIENSHRNMNTMFHATFIMKHAETIVATLMLNYCNVFRGSELFLDVYCAALPFYVFIYKENPHVTPLNHFSFSFFFIYFYSFFYVFPIIGC